MADGLAIVRGGHTTRLKWHRARKRATDLPFTAERMLEGLKLGASVEVDLIRHGGGGFAVLHDLALDHDTTGSGRVAETPPDELRALFLRDAAGQPTAHRLMLFEELCALIAAGQGISPEAVLQLDLKEGAAAITPEVVRTFAASAAPVARHFILSGGHPEAIRRLADAVPNLPLGFDPCHEGAIDRLLATRDFDAFVTDALAQFPAAEMIYLDHHLVLFAAEHDFDLIGAFHEPGKHIDAYTLTSADAANIEIAEKLLALKVDQITTDDPVGLEAVLGGLRQDRLSRN
jgi:glycerophosphoryl diester phosphodiesterase